MPAVEACTVKVEVWLPPRMTLVGVKVAFNPAEDTDDARSTVPVNPFTADIDSVAVPAWPTATETVVGLALIVKSWTV